MARLGIIEEKCIVCENIERLRTVSRSAAGWFLGFFRFLSLLVFKPLVRTKAVCRLNCPSAFRLSSPTRHLRLAPRPVPLRLLKRLQNKPLQKRARSERRARNRLRKRIRTRCQRRVLRWLIPHRQQANQHRRRLRQLRPPPSQRLQNRLRTLRLLLLLLANASCCREKPSM